MTSYSQWSGENGSQEVKQWKTRSSQGAKERKWSNVKRCSLPRSIFENGIKKQRFKQTADPYHLALAMDSLANAFPFLWLEAPERHPYPEHPDIILNILFQGLVDL